MRRRRRGRQLPTVSLFPFLAVLICTFGVLIILLVIVVKAADHQANQRQAEQDSVQQEELDRLQLGLELQLLKIDGYQTSRTKLLKELSDEKTRRANIQADIDKLASELGQVNEQVAMDGKQGQTAEQMESERAALQQQLIDQRDLLEKRRQAWSAAAEVKYSIVPYDGNGGTTRQPIYIECRKDEIIIQPYGIKLTGSDFVLPILPNNPLDAALIAIREYFIKNNLVNKSGTPYPLLIVRPDGSNAYAMARQAMKSWDEEFGYELIAADKQLTFGEADSQLKYQMLAAIEGARRRQREFVADNILFSNPARSKVQNAGGLQASSQLGGFVKPHENVLMASRTVPNETGFDSLSKPQTEESSNRLDSQIRGNTQDSKAKRNADIAVNATTADAASIADERGKNWALPDKKESAIAYRRPVRLYLSAHEIIIDSDSINYDRVRITIGDDLASTVEELVEAVWKRIVNWGVAGVGGYWKPELNIVVLPGAQRRFQQMQKLLDESGIDIYEERN